MKQVGCETMKFLEVSGLSCVYKTLRDSLLLTQPLRKLANKFVTSGGLLVSAHARRKDAGIFSVSSYQQPVDCHVFRFLPQ